MSKILKALNKVETARGSMSNGSPEPPAMEMDPSPCLAVGWPTRNILILFFFVCAFFLTFHIVSVNHLLKETHQTQVATKEMLHRLSAQDLALAGFRNNQTVGRADAARGAWHTIDDELAIIEATLRDFKIKNNNLLEKYDVAGNRF